ncbi:hypothetical protein GCM10008967_36900 [Bacillus carboniphilus]|uniref:Helix-turn-helix domain-containing protein n=1 Tax=Bacillus carboniphilus TaxID=86663 RepID=A0ABN0WQ15_9BACI
MNNKNIGVIVLGISMIISSFFIASAIDRIYIPDFDFSGNAIAGAIYSLNDQEQPSDQNKIDYRGTSYFYQSDLAEYLGMEYSDLKELLEKEEFDIPYIKINTQYIFYKDAVDQWLLEKQASFSVGDS